MEAEFLAKEVFCCGVYVVGTDSLFTLYHQQSLNIERSNIN
jgi:hypothetical protein